jgi:hypothetical protein
MTEDELRHELLRTDYAWAYGAHAEQIRACDAELLRDLRAKRWRDHGLSEQERADLDLWRRRSS